MDDIGNLDPDAEPVSWSVCPGVLVCWTVSYSGCPSVSVLDCVCVLKCGYSGMGALPSVGVLDCVSWSVGVLVVPVSCLEPVSWSMGVLDCVSWSVGVLVVPVSCWSRCPGVWVS